MAVRFFLEFLFQASTGPFLPFGEHFLLNLTQGAWSLLMTIHSPFRRVKTTKRAVEVNRLFRFSLTRGRILTLPPAPKNTLKGGHRTVTALSELVRANQSTRVANEK
ncbi:MAG: hypothetical protein DME26_01155 [Verrucomicrobia bacterium]|nr:MAG: hypothetical protein DME26_01155 [Verrucomicrobiota bacterium]